MPMELNTGRRRSNRLPPNSTEVGIWTLSETNTNDIVFVVVVVVVEDHDRTTTYIP